MRLRQIEVFHQVYANGSISAAARGLNVSQPAVSKVLRHFEMQLGIKLFELVRGRLVPTTEAHALFREADEIFDRVASLQVTAKNLKGSAAGHIAVGIVPSLGLDLTPKVVAAYQASHPGFTFDLRTVHHTEVLRSLHERKCDVVFGYDPPGHPRLSMRQLSKASLVVVAAPGQFDRTHQTLSLADLHGRELIGVSSSGPIGEIVSHALASAQAQIRMIASVDTFYVAAALARQGTGIAIIDEITASAMSDADLEIYPLAPALTFGVQAVWLEDRPLAKPASQFVELFKSMLRKSMQRAAT